ncbi:Uncharacterized protein BP5553_06817 [Venustampulla echinocandica]|uniref:Zn(2)-C6 fungal-type domain-containing protein n=1 Tax=Venustampulla echinocandica TaxID=2656787 RepID=A0A370TL20_9HELO|nr:Uncharacterized protein BP5553_06817 [Venustampulla echinocandica]RDL36205.1 Uncharacterized protein BP5553_06817 [Venustampulla echinocandica]
MVDESKPVAGLRRTHRKSRTGCKTCRSRHIRCDEKTPICRNCERSGRQCQYVTKHKVESDQQSPPPGLLWLYPQLETASFQPQELYLLQYLATFSSEVHFVDNKYSSWMRRIPFLMAEHRFLLDCVLGLSAGHHAVSKPQPDSSAFDRLALYYRGRGLRGLQAALNNFSESNADGALAASIILTWYLCGWQEWASLTHGIGVIQTTMRPYKENSCFVNLIEARDVVPEALQPLPPTSTESEEPAEEHVDALKELIVRLHDVKRYIEGHEEEQKLLDQIIGFAMMIESKLPMTSTHEQFESSKMLRMAIITVPPKLLQRVRRDPATIIVAAYFFAATLAVQPLFPAMGAMFFGFMALQPLSELARYLEEQRCDPVAATKYDWDEAASLMTYAMETVRRFRARLGWPTPPQPLVPAIYG